MNNILFCVNYDKWNTIDYKGIVEKICTVLNLNNKEISFLLTSDDEIQLLNKQYRKKNFPTNVLSFESNDSEIIGDIVISFDTLMKESIESEKSFENHFIHLVIHGILHLQGYDHITNKDAEVMEKIEIKTLEKLGIGNPYE